MASSKDFMNFVYDQTASTSDDITYSKPKKTQNKISDIDIDKLPGTDFQHDVWKALIKIPYGKTRTYAQVAQMSGHPNAVRAVANAIGKNPLPPIIPCHRVVRNDGSIGGYSAPGGIKEKIRLLNKEKSGA